MQLFVSSHSLMRPRKYTQCQFKEPKRDRTRACTRTLPKNTKKAQYSPWSTAVLTAKYWSTPWEVLGICADVSHTQNKIIVDSATHLHAVCVTTQSYVRHDAITALVTNVSRHDMMVSWLDMTILWLDTTISWSNTMSFLRGIVIVITGLWTKKNGNAVISALPYNVCVFPQLKVEE